MISERVGYRGNAHTLSRALLSSAPKTPGMYLSDLTRYSGGDSTQLTPIRHSVETELPSHPPFPPPPERSSLSDLRASSTSLSSTVSIHNKHGIDPSPPTINPFLCTSTLTYIHDFTMFRRSLVNAARVAGRAISASSIRSATRPVAPQIASPAVLSGRRQYHEKVLDHYSRPRNVGSMSKTDTDVGTGLVGAPACGDVMKLQIRVDPSNNTISDVKFKTFGCGSAIASSSYLTELVRGMTLEEAGRVRNTEIAKELCLPPVKRKISSPRSLFLISS